MKNRAIGCVPRVTSFLALCDTMDLLSHVQEGLVTPDQLEESILKHATLCKVQMVTSYGCTNAMLQQCIWQISSGAMAC